MVFCYFLFARARNFLRLKYFIYIFQLKSLIGVNGVTAPLSANEVYKHVIVNVSMVTTGLTIPRSPSLHSTSQVNTIMMVV